jgi:hypothetical protein
MLSVISKDAPKLVVSNRRLYVAMNESIGVIDVLILGGQGLLEPQPFVAPTPAGPLVTARMALGHIFNYYCISSSS